MLCPEQAFELAPDIMVIGNGDLGDETVQAQANGGVADAVFGRHLFQRTGGKHQALDEGKVFVSEVAQPTGRRGKVSHGVE